MAWREQFWIPCELFANRAEDLIMRILCIYMLQNKTKQLACVCTYRGRKHNTKNGCTNAQHRSIHLSKLSSFFHPNPSHSFSLQPLHSPFNPRSQPLQCPIIPTPMTLHQQHPQIRQSLLDFQRFRQRAHSKTLFRFWSRVVWRGEIRLHRGVEVGRIREGCAAVVPGWQS
jgi:hypothetical protein